MSRRDWGDALAAVFVLALIGIAVRPGSLAPAFVHAVGEAMVAVIGFAASSPAAAAVPVQATGGRVFA